ncbi:MAG: flagellar hook-associated protein FlgK [Anaerofustis sp.]
MKPTFLSYYIARSGIDAARANLQITGQNMTNASTKGYTRQRVDLYSVGTSGYNSQYLLKSDAYMGEGVNIGGISQIRDPYLDVHYRKEVCKVGDTSTQLDALSDLEDIFDETLTDGLQAQFSDLKSQLQTLASNSGDTVTEQSVQTSALMLVKLFNQNADQIQVAQDRQVSDFNDGAVSTVNELLKSISYLNGEIKSVQVVGDPALELQDQRNSLLDELSNYMNIEVSTKKITVSEGVQTEELSVNLVGANGEKFMLVDDDNYRRMQTQEESDGSISVKLLNQSGSYAAASNSFGQTLTDGDITDQFSTGSFHAYLKMINSSGEFDTPPSTDRGIPYYRNMLDTLANQFASAFNKANSTNSSEPYNKPLFEDSDGSGTITASNIALSEKWTNSTSSYLTATKSTSSTGTTESNENLLAMVDLFGKSMDFETPAHNALFSGSLEDFLTDISGTLSMEVESLDRMNETYTNNVSGIDEQRQSVSGVSLDEEGINLITFNQALTAASRFMTTMDEAIDTIINKMGIVGR